MTKPRRTEIRRIESQNARTVCFSKRPTGLFKKAEELKRLSPNIYVTAIVFSPAGKPFVYGDPDSVLHPFLSLPPPPSDLPRHHRHRDLLSVDISRLDRAELESYAHCLQLLRSRLISDDTVSFSESRVNSEFLNFRCSGSEFVGKDVRKITDTNIGFLSFSDSGLNSEFNFRSGSEIAGEGFVSTLMADFESNIDNTNVNSVSFTESGVNNSEPVGFSSGFEIVGEDVRKITDTNIGFVSFSDSGLNSEFNFRSGSEIAEEGFVSKLRADFESNIDDRNVNSVSFTESGVINSELLGFSSGSEVAGDDSGLWSGSGIDLDFNIDDFTISDLDAQITDSDDFLNLSELGFDFEQEEDKVVSFGDDFKPKLGIGVEEDEIEAVLRDFLNEGNDNDNCLNSVF